ncbi:helix-turn-helix transcriptional regulator [Calidifontibacter sp. DB0510]|uniref:Helix-turn-helix transcriptional regulator n=1 Tax=Metallococcus carri TaxID=1656884 RepID=A0A967E8X7_9MICO|nr:helix-turn-helix domain-containing protein [Metallococcus carri]NHN54274.1 helix-turn-helix transcriptional regulator [Metallococcus carri]NOP36886.1 helix-turn-helix transcriptional regulator [Calidifontibacter sp. DB2511S]
MADWTNATTGQRATSGVVLDPAAFARHATLQRAAPPAELAPLVDYYWSVVFDLPPGTSYVSTLVPSVSTHLSVEWGGITREQVAGEGCFLTGAVTRQRFDVRLTGRGGVAGVALRAGVLFASTGRPAVEVTDRVCRADRSLTLAPEVAGLRAGLPDAARTFDAHLAAILRPPTHEGETVATVLDKIDADRTLTTVAAVAALMGTTVRSTQRAFRRQLGVGPKWVLLRARVHDAVVALHAGGEESLASLAAGLGWADQAHFIRDFTLLVGEPPGSYRRRVGAPSGSH